MDKPKKVIGFALQAKEPDEVIEAKASPSFQVPAIRKHFIPATDWADADEKLANHELFDLLESLIGNIPLEGRHAVILQLQADGFKQETMGVWLLMKAVL